MSLLFVTGTGTGVGKTIATAALAAHGVARGVDVAVCKPVQTGSAPADGPGDDDLAEIGRLSGVRALVNLARYPEPLAPLAAAESAGLSLPTGQQIADVIDSLDRPGRLTLVEGAGGLLVELSAEGATIRDLAAAFDAPVLVVCEAGLGTLNHTGLTLEALAVKGISCAGLVIGSWPAQPGRAESSNRAALGRMATVRAVLPAGAATMPAERFAAMSLAEFDSGWVDGLI